MAKSTPDIVALLCKTAQAIAKSEDYQWGHMGSCNCGFLAQEITHLKKHEIHARAMQGHGDWNEQLNDYCPASGLPMDDLISAMLDIGFDVDDLRHLEKLSDPAILLLIPDGQRNLKHNYKNDVVMYVTVWADLLEQAMLDQISVSVLREPVYETVLG
jgi:hypothetical protein